MKIRIPFVAGVAIGYVLGTKAGRERYEQIVQQSRKLAENPRVQETAEMLRAKSGELAGTARQKVGSRRHEDAGSAGQPAETATERVPAGQQARTQTQGTAETRFSGARTETGTTSKGSGTPTGGASSRRGPA